LNIAEKVRVKGLGRYQKHGVYSIRDRGADALEKADRSLLMELEEQLASREGIDALLRRRAALAVIMVTKVEQYAEAQIEEGAPLESIVILGRWPAFQNAAGRALRAAKDTLPKGDRNKYGAELERIRRAVDGGAAQEDQTDAAQDPE
jgi:hypothetical protein